MMNFCSNKEIKANARDSFIGRMIVPVTATVIYVCISNILTICTSFPGAMTNLTVVIYSEIVSFVFNVVFGLIEFGIASFYLNYICGRPFAISDMWSGFFVNPGRTLIISLILTLLNRVLTLPATLYSYIYITKPDYKLYINFFVIFLVCSLVYYFINLFLAPIYFLAADLPDASAMKLFKMSFWLMKGRKFKYFTLQLSFLPLIFLGLISFGIGMLWVQPFINICYAFFYLDTTKVKSGSN